MSDTTREMPQTAPSALRIWLRNGAIWVALMALFGISLGTSYLKLGGASPILHVGIAIVQVIILWALFMDLARSSWLVRLCALTGAFWLIFLFSLTFADYLTRHWNGSGTSLAPYATRVGAGEHGKYPQSRLPLIPRFGPRD
jgi:cytochrome c oxidase subunit 4